ncbi:MAG: hypothetical protein GYB67_12210 [Chloroflexi bacterium]|nr:hypothetical protein [Chloroflexota bacterium]
MSQSNERRRKTAAEARTERATWGLLVLVFAFIEIVGADVLPNWGVPASGAVILFGSGVFQLSRRWRVSPVTWIAAVLLALLAYYGFQIDPAVSLLGESLIVFAVVIIFGVLTNET